MFHMKFKPGEIKQCAGHISRQSKLRQVESCWTVEEELNGRSIPGT